MARAVRVRFQPPHFVIRAGLATPRNLIAGTGPAPDGLTGFSTTSAPGVSVTDLAMSARYLNFKVSWTTVDELASLGYRVVSTPLAYQPLHCTVVTASPLSLKEAAVLSGAFRRKILNPAR